MCKDFRLGPPPDPWVRCSIILNLDYNRCLCTRFAKSFRGFGCSSFTVLGVVAHRCQHRVHGQLTALKKPCPVSALGTVGMNVSQTLRSMLSQPRIATWPVPATCGTSYHCSCSSREPKPRQRETCKSLTSQNASDPLISFRHRFECYPESKLQSSMDTTKQTVQPIRL